MSPEWQQLARGAPRDDRGPSGCRACPALRAGEGPLGSPVKAATLAPGISGGNSPRRGWRFVIRINRHDPAKRQRFSVAA